ncbi:S-adenosylmethionine decarboxylase proenzyme 4 [Cinnamomum micranthum f. kanehirae]|uniref:S-adenosylmethionine decarboxylase proenzyme n=1 Tax=Cinnamomum micranthum f. kanehirae TaxID=337451 RepID=A0A3S3NK14_9MAGN|nr:S-adenosylmethionine decarboxylase proenzyme 4 [Cinnamomum micranthum f. kanehirae]
MAVSGFEGFEKRLELHFYGDDPMGLRRLDFSGLQEVLDAVQCTVVSAVGNCFFDAYVLSESSLFVYPKKMIIKTCGTTQLLKSIPCLLGHADELGLTVCGCKYTRGNFIFPEAQPFPHTSFSEEVMYLEESLPNSLCYRKACIMPSKTSHAWHVYTASDDDHHQMVGHLVGPNTFTIEVCMTQLDAALARKFFRRHGDRSSGDAAGKEMTAATGIGEISPSALVCDFAFDPCGYSMNGVDGPHYSTIHVTPEDGYSYASFECVASAGGDLGEVLKKVVRVFRPGTMSVSICTGDGGVEMCSRVAAALRVVGYDARSCRVEDFPAAGSVTFQTFSIRRK